MKKVLLSILIVVAGFAAEYKLDPSHSAVGFKVKHMMITNTTGRFDDFALNLELDDKSNKITKLIGVVKTESINTDNEKRDEHLVSSDFFDSAKFPDMKFVMSEIKGDKIKGRLTIKDVTKEVEFDFENNGVIKDPWGKMRTGFAISGKIDRTDYGIKWNKLIEAGGMTVDNIVKLNVEIEAVKQ